MALGGAKLPLSSKVIFVSSYGIGLQDQRIG